MFSKCGFKQTETGSHYATNLTLRFSWKKLQRPSRVRIVQCSGSVFLICPLEVRIGVRPVLAFLYPARFVWHLILSEVGRYKLDEQEEQ